MNAPARKRFDRQYLPVANAISRAAISQTTRDLVARDLADAMASAEPKMRDFDRDLFFLLAADPLVRCAGAPSLGVEGCPFDREIRVKMHLSSAPDGKAASWSEERPVVQCVTCGAADHIAGYAENSEDWKEAVGA